jgi:hypothetical protein
MAVGEILDAGFGILRRHFGLVLSLAVITLAIPTAVALYVEFSGGVAVRPGLWALGQLLSLAGYLVVTGATVRVVSEEYLGRTASLGDALAFARGKLGRILGAGFASGLVIGLSALPAGIAWGAAAPMAAAAPGVMLVLLFLGLALLVLPVIVACGYGVVVQAASLEALGSALDALGRSWALTKGYRGRVFVLYLVVFALIMLVTFPFGLVAGMSATNPVLLVVAAALGMLTMLAYPVVSAVFTVLYYDLRVRKEAFDLELLSQQVGALPAA